MPAFRLYTTVAKESSRGL